MVVNPNSKNRKHKYILAACTAVICFIAVSCVQRDEVYLDYYEIKDALWTQSDTLFFEIDSTASYQLNVPYQLSLEVTNNTNYPYRNIWFFMQSNIENDSIFIHTSQECELADEYGKWKGSGFGSLYQTSFPVQQLVFHENRKYTIKVEHGMRDGILKGIEKIGIRIAPVTETGEN